MLDTWLEEKKSEIGTIIIDKITYVVLSIDKKLPTGEIASEVRFKVKTKLTHDENFVDNNSVRYKPAYKCISPVKLFIDMACILNTYFRKIKPKYIYWHFTNQRNSKIYFYYLSKKLTNMSKVNYNPYTLEPLKTEEELTLLLSWN